MKIKILVLDILNSGYYICCSTIHYQMRIFTGLVLLFLIVSSCNTSSKTPSAHQYTNALINETSPYLLQHAHNPVNWNPWNEKVLEQAQKEDKLLIISIGYAACHWCHVMEHESFEDSLVAQIMNDNYIPIKVDREERPDVDDVYMSACQLISGGGCGWPLNVFALPDGRPIWAGTYFPKDQWLNILEQFNTLKENDPQKLEDSAAKITQGIRSIDDSPIVNVSDKTFSLDVLDQIAVDFKSHIDFNNGGRKGEPKFPMPNNYDFLLRYHFLTKDSKALDAVTTTLDKMASGGIYDQLGGGFARYSVDSIWLVPHFEKMLYDNGQLLSLYAKAYKLTNEPRYKEVVDQTISFIKRELTSQEHGFYSSLDADSEGEEGKFYVWQKREIDSLVGDPSKSEIFNTFYNVTETGNWEHTNILFRQELNRGAEHEKVIADIESLLFNARKNRVRPGLDDKILTSWNGLMNKGLIDAYTATQNKEYLDLAIKNANFIISKVYDPSGRLYRNYKNGKATINGFLDDYATQIDAFIRLYEATFKEKWLEYADAMTQYTLQHFEDSTGYFYYTSIEDAPLVARKKELTDNVISASNSIMARNLYKLGELKYNKEYLDKSKSMVMGMIDQIVESRQPNFYANWCHLYMEWLNPPYEIAILGPNAQQLSLEIQNHFTSNAIYLGGQSEGTLELLKDKLQEGEDKIYVCKNKVCKFPVSTVDEAIKLMD